MQSQQQWHTTPICKQKILSRACAHDMALYLDPNRDVIDTSHADAIYSLGLLNQFDVENGNFHLISFTHAHRGYVCFETHFSLIIYTIYYWNYVILYHILWFTLVNLPCDDLIVATISNKEIFWNKLKNLCVERTEIKAFVYYRIK